MRHFKQIVQASQDNAFQIENLAASHNGTVFDMCLLDTSKVYTFCFKTQKDRHAFNEKRRVSK